MRFPIAAGVAALWSEKIGKLVFIAPFGLYEDSDPPANMWAVRPKDASSWLSTKPAELAVHMTALEGIEPVLWQIITVRGNEAAARFFWPLGNTNLKKRLSAIKNQTLLIWGADDRILPTSYAKRFADGIQGKSSIKLLPSAGHLVEFDHPAAVAAAIKDFVGA